MTKQYIAFDFETFLINTDYPFYGFQNAAPIPVCMSYQIGKQKPQICQDEMGTLLYDWLEDDDIILVGQNVAFDFMVAVTHLGVEIEIVFEKYNKGLVRDTMIREQLLALATGEAVKNPGKRYTLAALVEKYLKKDISASKGEDAWRLRYAELYDVPFEEWPQEAIDYPLDDATHTLKVFAHQHKERKFFEANELPQTRAGLDLNLITLNSPRVDPEQVEKFKEAHIHQVEAARAPLIKANIMKWNKNRYTKFDKDDERRGGWSMDNKKLDKVIIADYAKQGLVAPRTDPTDRFPDGQVKKDAETLIGCQNKYLKQYGNTAADIKLMDGFLPGLEVAAESVTRRVSPRYTVILKTGRTSCSRPNMQNPPQAPGVRECFIPEDGHVFVSIDFSSMEMYCLAQTVKDKFGVTELLDVLNAGKDPHIMVCENITGMSYEELLEAKEAGDEQVGKYRKLGKILNFGLGGGMGAETTVGNMSDSEIEILRELYPNEYPVPVMKSLSKIWKNQWNLVSFFENAARLCEGGRKPTYTCPTTGRLKALNSYCQYCNMHFQPIAADAMKEALRRVTESCYTEKKLLNIHGVKISAEIHDEFLMSGPEDSLDIWVPHVQQLMEEGAMSLLPDCKIQTEAGVCGERWRKKDIPLDRYLDGERHE